MDFLVFGRSADIQQGAGSAEFAEFVQVGRRDRFHNSQI
jgi:hypothetical protein